MAYTAMGGHKQAGCTHAKDYRNADLNMGQSVMFPTGAYISRNAMNGV